MLVAKVATGGDLIKVFLKISQNLQESPCSGVPFLMTGGDLIKVFLTRFWLGFFMNVKWLGGGDKNYTPPPQLSQEQNKNKLEI